MEHMTLLKLVDAVKKYKSAKGEIAALDGVSLEVAQGEFVAVTGPSGSGKSTLLHVLGLLDQPDSGEYICAGSSTAGLGDSELAALRAGLIGFVFQDFYALQELSAEENVALPLEYAAGLDPKACLELVELSDRGTHLPRELSGGQQQRLAIARAMVRSPRLILADEPTGNLDPRLRDEILSLLEKLNKGGVTVLVVTHDPQVAARAGRVLVMERGLVVSDTGPVPSAAAEAALPRPAAPAKRRLRAALAHEARSAAGSLRRNKWRSALIFACFAVGIGAVTASLGLVNSFQQRLVVRLEAIDPRVINVYPVRIATQLLPEDAALIAGKVPGVAAVRACSASEETVAGGGSSVEAQVYEINPDRVKAKVRETAAGRLPAAGPADLGSALLLRRTALQLFGSEAQAVGKQINIGRATFTVAGVLESYSHEESRGADPAAGVILPYGAGGVLNNRVLKLLEVEMAGEDAVRVAAWKIDGLLNPAAAGGAKKRFAVRQSKSFRDSLLRSVSLFKLFLLSLAAIPILLGGVAVANTMLLSVAERRGEIGLRKALGARRKDIAAQFLAESLLLYAAGGLAGAAIGVGAVYALSSKLQMQAVFSAASLFYGFSFLAAGGLVAGLWPALRAASVDPIRALKGD
jgi:macrolide transport system ATP-binding/permease protein